jgi:hypothetical protein
MKDYIKNYMTPIGCGIMLAAGSTFGQVVSGSVGVGVPAVAVTVPGVAVAVPGVAVTVGGGAVVAPDNYVYYPAYGVYYNGYSHQYAYQDRSQWVMRSAPMGISVDALQASPSVRMDFHDSPALHHAAMAKQYPRTWKPAASTGGETKVRQGGSGQTQVRQGGDRRDERGSK